MIDKKMFLIAAFAVICSATASAQAVITLSPQQVLNSDEFKTALGNDVSFYFAGTAPPSIKEEMGALVLQRTTTRGFGSPEATCRRVLLTLLRDFQSRAKGLGANAVINLQRVEVKAPAGDTAMIECLRGNLVLGRIALKGTFAQIEK